MKLKAFHNQYSNYLVLLFILGGYGVFFALNSILPTDQANLCMFKKVTGIPCPGCGMGRGTIELFHGNLLAALKMHPLAIPFNAGILITVFFLIKDVIDKETRFMSFMKQKSPLVYTIMIVLLVLVVWGWNMRSGI